MENINKHKKFIKMGIVALATIYTLQAIAIEVYNEFSNSNHNIKMVSLYNKIWPEIDKKDVTKEIQEYKLLATEQSLNFKFGLIPQKIRVALKNNNLPDAENVEISAKNLNKKTKLL